LTFFVSAAAIIVWTAAPSYRISSCQLQLASGNGQGHALSGAKIRRMWGDLLSRSRDFKEALIIFENICFSVVLCGLKAILVTARTLRFGHF
jgi:hypothetical protein